LISEAGKQPLQVKKDGQRNSTLITKSRATVNRRSRKAAIVSQKTHLDHDS